ncbi:MAG: hypothetical protein FJ297_11245 [Planctomycetes bacterium]|nr:hypothetical protein [Planctomycetota bacterium]
MCRFAAVTLALSGAIVGDSTSMDAEEPVRFKGLVSAGVAVRSEVTPVFEAEVAEALAAIPPVIWSSVRRSGWRCELVEFVVDRAPELKSARPRGWPEGVTWEQVDAVHLPADKLLILAEKRRTRAGTVVAADRVAGVLRHEVGHAYDVLGAEDARRSYRSSQDPFRAAYMADRGAISAEDAARMAYYLQARDAGRQEVFAESFAAALGGGSDPAREADLSRCFPRVMTWMRGELERVSRDSAAPSSAAGSGPETAMRTRRGPRWFRR